MIKLYQFPPIWNLPSASPFCTKLETYLRMSKLPYSNIYLKTPNKAPKGKLPYLVDHDKTIADSHLAIHHLKKTYGNLLDNYLTSKQRALGITIQRLTEEHFYWVIVFSRWIDPAGWSLTRKAFFQAVPRPLRTIVANKVRKYTKNQLYQQGLGRHTPENIYSMGKEDIYAISHLLGNNYFILGEHPTSFDASVYAFINNVLQAPIECPIKRYIQSLPNLTRYCQRMTERYYPAQK